MSTLHSELSYLNRFMLESFWVSLNRKKARLRGEPDNYVKLITSYTLRQIILSSIVRILVGELPCLHVVRH